MKTWKRVRSFLNLMSGVSVRDFEWHLKHLKTVLGRSVKSRLSKGIPLRFDVV